MNLKIIMIIDIEMDWSNVVKTNIDKPPKVVEKKKTNIVIKDNTYNEYLDLYQLKFNADIDDLYTHLKTTADQQQLNILNDTELSTYGQFFKLIFDNTDMIINSDEDSDSDIDEELLENK